jgi:hypothetical protein
MSRDTAEVLRARKIEAFQRQRSAQRRMTEILRIRNKRRGKKTSSSSSLLGVSAADREEVVEDDDLLLNGDDDELEREHVLLVIRSGIRDALDTLSSHVQESQMLAHMAKMMGGGSNGRRSPNQKDPRTKAHEEKHRKIQAMEAYKNRPGMCFHKKKHKKIKTHITHSIKWDPLHILLLLIF